MEGDPIQYVVIGGGPNDTFTELDDAVGVARQRRAERTAKQITIERWIPLDDPEQDPDIEELARWVWHEPKQEWRLKSIQIWMLSFLQPSEIAT